MTQPCMAIPEDTRLAGYFPAVKGDGRCSECIRRKRCIVCLWSDGKHTPDCHTQRRRMTPLEVSQHYDDVRWHYCQPHIPLASIILGREFGIVEFGEDVTSVCEQIICAAWETP